MFMIGEAAKRSGVNIETIRYYEREGIIPQPLRLPSGRRTYDLESLARLKFVKRCRDLGFSISEVRTFLALAADQALSCGKARPIAEAHLTKVREKMADLKRMQDELTRLISRCSDPDGACPMLTSFLSTPLESP